MSLFGPAKPGWLSSGDVNPFSRSRRKPAGGHTISSSIGPNISMFVNAVYYPNWHIYKQRPPSSLRLDVISHIFYAFAWITEDGTVYLKDDWADDEIEVDGTNGCLRACTALKQRFSHLKVILSIGGSGGGGEQYAQVAADPTKRETFASTARQLVNSYRLDGVDVDWEQPSSPTEGDNYLSLLTTLRQFLPRPDYILTSSLPAIEWVLSNIPLAQAVQHLTYLNLIAYDFAGPWSSLSGHHAQLYPSHPVTLSGSAATAYCVANNVPSHIILLGIPCYGRSFLNATGPGQVYTGHGGENGSGTFEYCDLPRPGAREVVDELACAAYCVGGDGGFVSYDVPATVTAKALFVRTTRLGGLFYWSGTGDKLDAGEERSLVMAGYCALHL